MISDDELQVLKPYIDKQVTRQICSKCKGYGVWEEEHLADYHKREYTYIKHDCEECEKRGIVQVTEYRLHGPYFVKSKLE